MATIGLDIAKSVFQVHGVGKRGLFRRSVALATITGPGLLLETIAVRGRPAGPVAIYNMAAYSIADAGCGLKT